GSRRRSSIWRAGGRIGAPQPAVSHTRIGTPSTPRTLGRRTALGIYSIKPAFGRALGPVERALIRAGVSADALTAAGFVFAAAAGIGVWLGVLVSGWHVLDAAS